MLAPHGVQASGDDQSGSRQRAEAGDGGPDQPAEHRRPDELGIVEWDYRRDRRELDGWAADLYRRRP